MLKQLTSARTAKITFPVIIFLGYSALPLVLVLCGVKNDYFPRLARLALIASCFIYLGAVVPIPLHRIPKMTARPELFISTIWLLFTAFVILTCITSGQIPLLASLRGADAETISRLREEFLKARVGWQASFVYINAIFSGFLIPYSVALMFLNRYRFRWVFFSAFLLYTLSFAEKAFFFKAVLPLFFLLAQGKIVSIVRPSIVLLCIMGLLVVVTMVSRLGVTSEMRGGFFSSQYIPRSPLEYMVWRTVSVPLTTAADALKVFEEDFGNTPLRGATSSFLAKMSGRDRVPFEQMVFASEWGQNETGTGSSNSVFLTEAYVNGGTLGVMLFSLAVGLIIGFLGRTRDMACQSLWLLLAIDLYVAGLIGTLLSNGLILVLLLGMFVKFRSPALEYRAIGQLTSAKQQ